MPDSKRKSPPAKTSGRKRPRNGVLGNGRFLRLVSHNGWEYVERQQTSGIVVIVAVTRARKLLLIEQFRPPVGKRVIELPAGLAGDTQDFDGESLETAARRELLEETGYAAGSMTRLTAGPISAGLSTEILTFYRARGLRKVGDGGGDHSEDIQVHEVPLDDVDRWLGSREDADTIIDPKVYIGLYFAQTPSRRRPPRN